MTKTFGSRARIAALSVLSAAALAASLGVALPAATAAGGVPFAPAATTGSVAATGSGPSTRVVTLVTGDRVVLRHDAQGHTTASLTPDSPDYGRPVQHIAVGTHTWVIPRLAASLRARIDPSLFDVSALTTSSGQVPLTVTFARGAQTRSLPGLDVRTGSARTTSGGRTTVTASYDASRPLPRRFATSLAGVSRIAVKGADAAPQSVPDYQLSTLTINATNAQGAPLRVAEALVINLDDLRLFVADGLIYKGQWKVSVPQGHYLIITNDFRRLVASTTDVEGDTSMSASLADATIRPSMTLPGHRQLDPELDLMVSDSAGRTGDIGFGGLLPRLSPLPTLGAGHLATELSDIWSAKGYQQFSQTIKGRGPTISFAENPIKTVSAAKVVRDGIPRHLAFRFGPRDFAKVAIQHFATGPKQRAMDSWNGWSPADQFAVVQSFPSLRPGVIRAQFAGDRDITWASYTTVDSNFRSNSMMQSSARYRPGQHARIPFFRGPVTPVVGHGSEFGVTGANCALCVTHGRLHGLMSMMTSAGTDQVGSDDKGQWQLYGGKSELQSGRQIISPNVRDVAPGTRLVLLARTAPADPAYRLSSHVLDGWLAKTPASGPVPILRADYVPPTTLDGVARHRRESFTLRFDNLGPHDSRVIRAGVGWSTGAKWHHAALKRLSGRTFRVTFTNPAAIKGHPYVSLQVHARDAAGRRMIEIVQHAYLLPQGSTRPAHPAGAQHRAAFRPGTLCRTAGSRYGCFVKLSPATRAAGRATPDPAGWGAPALRDAYDLSGLSGDTTVGVIDAFHLPTAEQDMNTYRKQYGLPPCTVASGCFTQLNQNGEAGSYPRHDASWGVEESLDLQMVSAACPTCHIVLVEAKQPTDGAFAKAEAAAVAAGATVTTHSYGRQESTGTDQDAGQYDHPGVTAVASTGDYGYGPATFPAGAPNVIGVGGTTLARSADDPRGWTERAWRYAASGCSAYFDKVPGQTDTACHGRTESDVSAIAQGLAIYDTSVPAKFRGWLTVDGTSASSPLIAGVIGASGSAGLRPSDLYAEPEIFNDVIGGSNGFCQGSYLCTAVAGYDGPTGLGTPDGAIPIPR